MVIVRKEVILISKIMIVDDNKDIIKTLRMILEKEGYDVVVAYDGKSFLDSVKSENPDLVLLDMMMPGLTTREIIDGLKLKNLPDLKVILVTVVRCTEEEKQELFKEGIIIDYITKPFDVMYLLERIKDKLL